MSDALFRQEVIEAGRNRLAGAVVASVPPSSRSYTALVLVVTLGIALLLGIGSYAGRAAVRGIVTYDAGTSRVYAPAGGEVRQLHVRLGDLVAAGAPLATLSLAQGPHGLAAQIAELGRQIAEIDRQLALANQGAATDSAGLDEQRALLAQTIASLERQRGIAQSQVSLAERAATRNGRLAREGAGSRQQEEEARSDLLARRAAAEALDERLIATRGTLADTAKRLQRTGIDTEKARSELLAHRAALTGQADALRRSDSLVVTAPIAGTVADLAAQPGQRVTDRVSVATLVPLHAALQVHLFAPSRAVGFAHPGEEVRLRFDAFPYQKYGAVCGTVVAVSPVTIDPASIDPALDLHDPVFRVTVRIDPARPLPVLRPGMTLSADLLMARRPLWTLIVGPIREASRS